ncbi:MAG: BolA family transcriptional regulator [Halobacteriovoraceae bacterium]|nr:BolA family transcriptional regulator [Halobacteriovoraceae bacterium]|tara:strand:- start:342429 stop:342674 length:246 start_codon:yes stop_codon:yes gene_type:complete
MTPMQEVEQLIKKNIEDAHVEVSDLTGTMDHLNIFVASDIFKGKMLIDQHQIIMDILKEDLKDKIHAVKIKTMTKEKYDNL